MRPRVRRKGDLCPTCMPRPYRRSRAKELQVAAFLYEWRGARQIPRFVWNKQNPNADPVQCGRFRVDFVFKSPVQVVALEVDEQAHRTYDLRCELVRMAEASLAYGGRPVHWIRYNPDSFKIDGVGRRMSQAARMDLLKARLMGALAQAPDYDHFLTIEFICYDTPGRFAGLQPAGFDVGADGEVQLIKLRDIDHFRVWCTECGVKID